MMKTTFSAISLFFFEVVFLFESQEERPKAINFCLNVRNSNSVYHGMAVAEQCYTNFGKCNLESLINYKWFRFLTRNKPHINTTRTFTNHSSVEELINISEVSLVTRHFLTSVIVILA